MNKQVLRIRNRVLRELLSRYLRPRGSSDLVRLGSQYGGWWVPKSVLRADAVAYCAGAGEDITFDLALLEHGLRVTTFDPTPRAINHVAATAPHNLRFRFEPIGWWDTTADLKFFAPLDPSHVSHSIVNLQGTTDYFVAHVEPVDAIADRLGDRQIDLIKMDIEGAEYQVIQSMLSSGPLPEVLCVEFDQPTPTRRLVRAVRQLTHSGYVLVYVDGWNYTFARR